MTEKNNILAQASVGAAAETVLFTVEKLSQARIEGITVCNRGATASSFRLSFARAGAVTSNEQFIYYDLPISANNTFMATLIATLLAADVVRVYSTQGSLSVTLYGQKT